MDPLIFCQYVKTDVANLWFVSSTKQMAIEKAREYIGNNNTVYAKIGGIMLIRTSKVINSLKNGGDPFNDDIVNFTEELKELADNGKTV